MSKISAKGLVLLACALAIHSPQSAGAALLIERLQGEPLRPKLEQLRLAQLEASARLDALRHRREELLREIDQIEVSITSNQAELAKARQNLEDWQHRIPDNTEMLRQTETAAEKLRQAIPEHLADLTQARAQNDDPTRQIRLEGIVRAMVGELQKLEARIQAASQAIISAENAATNAENAEANLVPELEMQAEALLSATAEYEELTGDLEFWQQLTDERDAELEHVANLIEALNAEEGLQMRPPLPANRAPDDFRQIRTWPIPHQETPAEVRQTNVVVMPVDGQIVSQFGEARVAPLDQGILIEAPTGSRIVAPRAGQVVFAGPFQSYGQLLIIDHGDGYHTLLSGFDWLGVAEDTAVEAGQLVGSLASDRTGNSRLYLELRRRGKPANPLPWLAANEDKVRG